MTERLSVIDSHTEGEPTRVIVDGVPAIRGGSMREKRDVFRQEHDWIRTACILEPRGHEAMVGALLCDSTRDDCVAGVIFFNNSGVLWGCIHGTIGVAKTLQHLGRVGPGRHGIETPAGRVEAELRSDGSIAVTNVRCFRDRQRVTVAVKGIGEVCGDVAWGGNWFFLLDNASGWPLILANARPLSDYCLAVGQALADQGITGLDGAPIDHVELFEAHPDPIHADSRNFVCCPGGAYDRSPCGTGTSAKLACLAADGKLREGEFWRQAGILDTVFRGTIRQAPEGGIYPVIAGRAWINGQCELFLDPDDPFRFGIPASGVPTSGVV